MNEVLRQEKKFLITLRDFYTAASRLERVLHADGHNRGDGYAIRSLYFDTPEDRDFQEKEDGVELRRKIRLRCYGPDSDSALLELKQKQGAMQKKRSLRVQKACAQELLRGNYSVLLREGDPFAAECYALLNLDCYRPRAVVEYRRKAFVARENRTRITFDHHIVGTESNFDLFSPSLCEVPVLDSSLVILEVKYNGFLLSYIKDLLAACNVSELSAGKYSMGRAVSKHYRF